MSDDRQSGKIRMPQKLREELSDLADEEWIRDLTDEEYLDGNEYNRVLSAIIPENADALDWDMVEAHNIDHVVYKRIFELAGDNVSGHDVIRHFVNEAKRKHATGEWIANSGIEQQTSNHNDNDNNE